ncbi:autotransporter outer membrane beta-barrel domain-containing protein [uncultured Nitratireductor sp.]|uniref:autotransporter outer membrane beta-barrel domain-containing protein n=1 Tax=uncultured Nitratireductor sp. TaxID=520953 RepID=UPI0025E17E25|nr:autotransporter outer membrane beta-barrel domain-containing protein [uncultured Nitratireductor sp.]
MFSGCKRTAHFATGLAIFIAFLTVVPEKGAAEEALDMAAIHARQLGRAADSEARQLSIVRERLANTRRLRARGGNAEAILMRLHVKRRDHNETRSKLLDTGKVTAEEKLRRTPRLARWMGGEAVLSQARTNDPRASALSTKGVAFGADYRVNPRLLIGHAMGMAYDRSPLSTDMTYSARMFSETLYGTVFTGNETYLDFAVGAARSRFSGRVDDGTRTPGASGDRVFAMLRASRVFTHDVLSLRGYGEGRFSQMHFNGTADGLRDGATRMTLGLTGETKISTRRGRLTPHAGLEWSLLRKEGTVPGETLPAHRLEESAKITATAGFDWALNPRATLKADYGLTADPRAHTRKQTVKTHFTLRF